MPETQVNNPDLAFFVSQILPIISAFWVIAWSLISYNWGKNQDRKMALLQNELNVQREIFLTDRNNKIKLYLEIIEPLAKVIDALENLDTIKDLDYEAKSFTLKMILDDFYPFQITCLSKLALFSSHTVWLNCQDLTSYLLAVIQQEREYHLDLVTQKSETLLNEIRHELGISEDLKITFKS